MSDVEDMVKAIVVLVVGILVIAQASAIAMNAELIQIFINLGTTLVVFAIGIIVVFVVSMVVRAFR